MEGRIFGTECEYALFHNPSAHPADSGGRSEKLRGEARARHFKELAGLLVSALHGEGRSVAGEFLGNGGRFYIDRGNHPEYATPECRSVKDLVAHEKAGDRIVQGLVETARIAMAREKVPGKLQVFKNNLDTHGNTYGSHENYLVTPRAMELIRDLIPFLLTRQIFAGAGWIADDPGPADAAPECAPFRLSQRADFFDRVFSDRTSETRGIINTRKREIHLHGQNVRLHIILGDSNMSEYALGLKVGSTALVLKLLEEEKLQSIPGFSKPVEALKGISRDLASVHGMEGRKAKYTALDVQCMYLERARQFFASRASGPEEKEVLDLWEHTLVGLDKLRICNRTGAVEDDPGELARKLDWVLKLWLLNRSREKMGLAWSDPRLKHLDLKYHDLDAETSIFERCVSLDLVDRLVSEDEITLAQREPPRNTRAWMRGMIIQEAARKDMEVIVKDWEAMELLAKPMDSGPVHAFDRHRMLANSLKVGFKDPFESQDLVLLARVCRFIDGWGEKRAANT